MKEEFVFFAESKHPFSQWYPDAPFTKHGITFQTAENYMMWRKGQLFGAHQNILDAMISASPRNAKALGRKVPNFDLRVWQACARSFVAEGNYAKFTQNASIRKTLFATAGKTLVEAAPWDTVWGIGLIATDPCAFDRNTWLGTNWLGEVLTEVRNTMMAGMTHG